MRTHNNIVDSQVDHFVVEEMLYRQALEMCMNKDDHMIHSRLRQTNEFIAADAASILDYGDAMMPRFDLLFSI